MTCKAYQQSDEMYCPSCDRRWDVNDPEPPKCPHDAETKNDANVTWQQLSLFKR